MVMMLSRMHRPVVNQHRRNTSWEEYDGKVYCAETSTGVLVVRRNGKIVLSGNSPFEQVELVFRCRMPIFVARQWVRHRTAHLNEMSARYRTVPAEAYLPEWERLQGEGKSNKQGSEGELDGDVRWKMLKQMAAGQEAAFATYEDLGAAGLSKELKRINLPLASYTEWFWKIDLHNLLHFCSLRCDSHAQWEIRQYADKLFDLACLVAPWSCEAWLEHSFHAVTFNRSEAKHLRALVRELATSPENIATRVHSQLKRDGFDKKSRLAFIDKLGLAAK